MQITRGEKASGDSTEGKSSAKGLTQQPGEMNPDELWGQAEARRYGQEEAGPE